MPTQKPRPKDSPPVRTEDPVVNKLNATGRQLNSTSADFLKIDAETARTFAGLALETDNVEKKDRNRKNARKAYDTILHLWDSVTFTSAEEAYMKETMEHLKLELTQLGEKF